MRHVPNCVIKVFVRICLFWSIIWERFRALRFHWSSIWFLMNSRKSYVSTKWGALFESTSLKVFKPFCLSVSMYCLSNFDLTPNKCARSCILTIAPNCNDSSNASWLVDILLLIRLLTSTLQNKLGQFIKTYSVLDKQSLKARFKLVLLQLRLELSLSQSGQPASEIERRNVRCFELVK